MNNPGKKIEWGKKTYIMGVINLTPDSFSGDGVLLAQDPQEYALKKTIKFLNDGADIIFTR